jgi:hypothetical protein
MQTNKYLMKRIISISNLTLIVALSLSTIAAYYSIIGLTAIFAGAVVPVIVMGSILEIGKITTTVWLRKYWHRASWVLRLYLVPAVLALAMLTSMGIFGFLSKAHMDSGVASGDIQAKLALYDEKIKTEKDNIDTARKALQQMDAQLEQLLARGSTEQNAERAVTIRRQQAKERGALQADMAKAQAAIAKLNEERAPIAAENRKVEAEVGPIKYIAALIYGDNADQNMLEAAVRWVIILLVIVFDPLAIALVLAANASKEWDKEEPEEESDKPDAWVADVDEKPTEEELKEEPEVVEPPAKEDDFDISKHPYLFKTGGGFKNLTPMVYKPELEAKPEVIEEFPTIVPEEPIVEEPVIEEPVIEEPVIEEPVIEEPVIEEPIVDTTPVIVEALIPEEELIATQVKELTAGSDVTINEVDGGYVIYEGKMMSKDALKSMKPELFKIKADTVPNTSTSFGTHFPQFANKGDIFVRVDNLPNRVFKFDGHRWIEINKDTSQTYLQDDSYIQFLISKIDSGEYDIDLLSEYEKEQIESYLKTSR